MHRKTVKETHNSILKSYSEVWRTIHFGITRLISYTANTYKILSYDRRQCNDYLMFRSLELDWLPGLTSITSTIDMDNYYSLFLANVEITNIITDWRIRAILLDVPNSKAAVLHVKRFVAVNAIRWWSNRNNKFLLGRTFCNMV